MDDDEPDAVAAMLEYLYKEDYAVSYPSNISKDSSEAKGHEIMFHLHVYALADKLRIPILKALATLSFLQVVRSHWSNPSFPAAIQFVYSIAPPGKDGDRLRNIVVSNSGMHAKELFADPTKLFASMMENIADFGKDLSQWLAENVAVDIKGENWTCPACSFEFKAVVREDLDYLTCPTCTTNEAIYKWRGLDIEVERWAPGRSSAKKGKARKGKNVGGFSPFG